MGTTNFNSYFFGCIVVLTTKYHFWLTKLVSLQKIILPEDLFANLTNLYTIEGEKTPKTPLFLQDASDMTIEKCLLSIAVTHFTLSSLHDTYFDRDF